MGRDPDLLQLLQPRDDGVVRLELCLICPWPQLRASSIHMPGLVTHIVQLHIQWYGRSHIPCAQWHCTDTSSGAETLTLNVWVPRDRAHGSWHEVATQD